MTNVKVFVHTTENDTDTNADAKAMTLAPHK